MGRSLLIHLLFILGQQAQFAGIPKQYNEQHHQLGQDSPKRGVQLGS
jgi:hypothetical protein